MDYKIEVTDNTNDGETITTGFMYKFAITVLPSGDFADVNNRICSWCMENLSRHEYYVDVSKWKGIIYIYTHTYETSMAFKLSWT